VLSGLIEGRIAGEVELLLMPPVGVIGHVEVIIVIRCKRRLAPIETREGHSCGKSGQFEASVTATRF
jgi:hypothetical protein